MTRTPQDRFEDAMLTGVCLLPVAGLGSLASVWLAVALTVAALVVCVRMALIE